MTKTCAICSNSLYEVCPLCKLRSSVIIVFQNELSSSVEYTCTNPFCDSFLIARKKGDGGRHFTICIRCQSEAAKGTLGNHAATKSTPNGEKGLDKPT
jgi:hypothetical protein